MVIQCFQHEKLPEWDSALLPMAGKPFGAKFKQKHVCSRCSRYMMKTVTEDSTKETLSAIKTALIIDDNGEMRRSLSEVVRESLNYRVLEAGGISEGRYLAAVEGRISLLFLASLSKAHCDFALWFLAAHPECMVLVAEESLWELTEGAERCEQMLVAKAYTLPELASTLQRLLIPKPQKFSEPASKFSDNEAWHRQLIPRVAH